MAGSCEHGNEPSSSIKAVLSSLAELLNKDSRPSS
jgi:hypothetical protein